MSNTPTQPALPASTGSAMKDADGMIIRLGSVLRNIHDGDQGVVSAWRKYHPKAVRVRCIETGREFPTILEASEHSGYSPAHLGRLAKAGKGWVLV